MDVEATRARLARRLAAGPDAEALARLERFLEAAAHGEGGLAAALPSADAEVLLCDLLAQSPALARDLVREPSMLAALAASPFLQREKPVGTLRAELADALARPDDPARTLRRFRNREYLRLGARELGRGAPHEVGRELAALAAVCLDAAVDVAGRELSGRLGEPRIGDGGRCRFVAMGMGKLGGEELNFSSDIDLVYLYETDAGAAGGTSLHEYFARLAERATRLVAEATADGACFRVDLRLRPEGSRGPLVNSLEAAERYYETWGRPWERQAWIKARPVAGDLDLGTEVLARLEPMVWPRAGVTSAVADVHALMKRIRAELRDEHDVKLGRGGIREVEFFVQALQLVHGGRRRELRERGTLRALDRLLFAGLVSEREHRQLGDAYVFLRRVEHRLQLVELRQTHALPAAADARALLARRLGFADAAAFDGALGAQRDAVAAIYATLGAVDETTPVAFALLLDPTADRAVIEATLAQVGFRDVTTCADELELLRAKPASPFAASASGSLARAAPRLLAEAAASPDPDLALRRLVDLAARGAPAEVLWRLAADAEVLGRLLVSLFGTSEFLSRMLVAHPDLADELLTTAGTGGAELPGTRTYAALIARRLADNGSADEEEQLDVVRRARNQELLRLGLRDVGGAIDTAALGAALTALAEACIEATLAIVRPAVEARWGRARTALSVVGLGKLGAGEMTWSSDLDVIFVYRDEEAAVDGGRGDTGIFEVMSRLAQRLLHGLSAQLPSGRLYEVDTRLRPSGRQGALVSSLAGFVRYHGEHAALWERQALIKLRAVAGDAELGAEVEAAAARFLWSEPDGGSGLREQAGAAAWAAWVGREIDRVRTRQIAELTPRPGRHNVKTGPGGLVDIEFLTQYLQLIHGPAQPSLRPRGTASALDALGALGLLAPAEHAELAAALTLLRRLENRMRIVEDRPSAELGGGPHELDKLARRLGYHGGGAGARLLADFLAAAARVRAIYRRHLPLDGLAGSA